MNNKLICKFIFKLISQLLQGTACLLKSSGLFSVPQYLFSKESVLLGRSGFEITRIIPQRRAIRIILKERTYTAKKDFIEDASSCAKSRTLR